VTDAELIRLLRSDEHNLVERKSEGVKRQEIRQTLCAFANSTAAGETAVLFVGVHDRTGEIIGVQDAKAVQQRVAEAASDCAPPVRYKARELEVEGRRVLAALVCYSTEVPHFSGPAYIREGDRSKRATATQHEELIASRNSTTRQLLDWQVKYHRIMVSAFYKRLGIAELNQRERWGRMPVESRMWMRTPSPFMFSVREAGPPSQSRTCIFPRSTVSRRFRSGHGCRCQSVSSTSTTKVGNGSSAMGSCRKENSSPCS
jgi:hypothetical protein